MREEDIKRIIKESGLPKESFFRLDSIAYQLNPVLKPLEVVEEVEAVATIARRYSQENSDVLAFLDEATTTYLERKLNRKNNVGSFSKVNAREVLLESRGNRLNYRGLKDRVDEDLYGLESRPLPPPRGSTMEDGPGPWQENAIRALEG